MPRRVPISDAAKQLGLSLDTARKQVQRGLLPAEKIHSRWYVLLDDAPSVVSQNVLDPSQTEPAAVREQPQPQAPDREIATLREFLAASQGEIEFLRAELTSRTEELRRKDIIIADLTRRMPELPCPSPPTPESAQPQAQPSVWSRLVRWFSSSQ